MAATGDLKSSARNSVKVRILSLGPIYYIKMGELC